jgi:hypothetical protein
MTRTKKLLAEKNSSNSLQFALRILHLLQGYHKFMEFLELAENKFYLCMLSLDFHRLALKKA